MRHPATYPQAVLNIIDGMLEDAGLVLDPFAGIGGVHQLGGLFRFTVGVEIEPEWARQHPGTIIGDSRRLPFADDTFDAIATSPAYGNRMADAYDGRDGSRRMTYRIALGRPLTEGNAAALQWGDQYRQLHREAWAESVRVLRPGGRFILNVKDHVRGGRQQRVTLWHSLTLQGLGLRLEERRRVNVRGNANVTDPTLRDIPEQVMAFTA